MVDLAICYHEGGHAVSAWKHSAILTFLAADGSYNEVRFKHEGNWGHNPDRISESILITCCGPVAELKFTGEFFNSELCGGEMRDLLEKLAVGDRYHLHENWNELDYWAAKSAPAHVFCTNAENWELITLLAKRLQVKKYMTGLEAAKFLEKSWRDLMCDKLKFDVKNLLKRPAGVIPWRKHGS